jgi:hypothetical protein
LSEFSGGLNSTLATLDGMLAEYTPRNPHYVADLILHGFARDVSTHVHATILVADSNYPRAAYANARSAFEAAQDAALLASDTENYDINGALAFCVEQVEHEALQKRWEDAAAEWGIVKDRTGRMSPEELIEKESRELDSLCPGAAQLLRTALIEARAPRRAQKHWSGKSRAAISKLLEKRMPSFKGIAAGGDAFYGMMSVQSHPRLRAWSELRSIRPDGSLHAEPGSEHSSLPIGLAAFAVQLTIVALATRLGDSSAINGTA